MFHWFWIFLKPITIYQTFKLKYCCSIHWNKFGKCARAVCRAPSKKQPFIRQKIDWGLGAVTFRLFYLEIHDFVIQHLLSICFHKIIEILSLIIKPYLESFYIRIGDSTWSFFCQNYDSSVFLQYFILCQIFSQKLTENTGCYIIFSKNILHKGHFFEQIQSQLSVILLVLMCHQK